MPIYNFAISGFAGNGKTTALQVIKSQLEHHIDNVIILKEIPRQTLFLLDYFSHKKYNIEDKEHEKLFQFGIMSAEFEKMMLIKQLQKELDCNSKPIVFLHDRTYLDNLIYAVIKGVITENQLEDILSFISNFEENYFYYDLIFLIDKVPEEEENFIKKIMKDKGRNRTIVDFRKMEQKFYDLFFYYTRYSKKVKKFPHPKDNPLVPLLIYSEILKYLKGDKLINV